MNQGAAYPHDPYIFVAHASLSCKGMGYAASCFPWRDHRLTFVIYPLTFSLAAMYF